MSIQTYERSLCCNSGLAVDDAGAASRCQNREGAYMGALNLCQSAECPLDVRILPVVLDCPAHGSSTRARSEARAPHSRG